MLRSTLALRSLCIRISSVPVRLCSSDAPSASSNHKDYWPAMLRHMEARNPVHLKRRPELFAEGYDAHREGKQSRGMDSKRHNHRDYDRHDEQYNDRYDDRYDDRYGQRYSERYNDRNSERHDDQRSSRYSDQHDQVDRYDRRSDGARDDGSMRRYYEERDNQHDKRPLMGSLTGSQKPVTYAEGSEKGESFAEDAQQVESYSEDSPRGVYYAGGSQRGVSYARGSQRGMSYSRGSQRGVSYDEDLQSDASYDEDSQRDLAYATGSQKSVSYVTDSQRGVSYAEDLQSDTSYPDEQEQMFGKYSETSRQLLRQLAGSDDRNMKDESEGDRFVRCSPTNGPKSLLTYESKLERLCKRARMAEAQALFDQLIKEFRVSPTSYMYSNLVKGYASLGEMDKCFRLYNQMKKRGLNVRSQLYTSLFTACSNFTGDQQLALKAATSLLGGLRYSETSLHPITYKAAVKTFGMLGDLETAFQLADECPSAAVDEYMLSALLMACNSNKKAGFQLAISVWRSMRKKNVHISIYQYNLLLRTLYSGTGDLDTLKGLIQHKVATEAVKIDDEVTSSPYELTATTDLPRVERSTKEETDDARDLGVIIGNTSLELSIDSTSPELSIDRTSPELSLVSTSRKSDEVTGVSTKKNEYHPIPDILNAKLKIPADIEIKEVNTPAHRLMLLGGVPAILRRMAVHKCKPNIKTFFYILRALPAVRESEAELLSVMKEVGVKPDNAFYKYILVRMSHRNDTELMWQMVEKMRENNVNIDTDIYALLATSCSTHPKCRRLLEHMTSQAVPPNLKILKHLLLWASCTHFQHLSMIAEEMERCNIKPDAEYLDIIERKFQKAKLRLVEQETGATSCDRVFVDSEAMRQYDLSRRQWSEHCEEEKSEPEEDRLSLNVGA